MVWGGGLSSPNNVSICTYALQFTQIISLPKSINILKLEENTNNVSQEFFNTGTYEINLLT